MPEVSGVLMKLRLTGWPLRGLRFWNSVEGLSSRPHRQPGYWSQPRWPEGSPEAAGALGGRGQPRQQVTTYAPETPPRRDQSGPSVPEVSPAALGTYTLVGPPPGRNETF